MVGVAGCDVTRGSSAASTGTTSPTATTGTAAAAATTSTASTSASAGAAAPSLAAFSDAITQVVDRVKPAVVQITDEQQVQINQFSQATVPAGVGSGVIFDAQGHILTNNHVVEGAQRLVVSLPDGRTFKDVKIVGTDPQTDLAVLQISGDNLPVAPLGDSNALKVGNWVVAIGNALALPGGPTVTVGVVSALGRTVQEPGDGGQGSGPYLFNVIQ
ncbi:MAG: trypsin-like peptidase domain-containing protein, partial [Thermomicrobiaceae bacterium]|nr:trypsin-like peptidase domain-containing protein [Thermomicrobiaceae bacterium]